MPIDFHAILPELVLAGTALLVLVVDLFVEERAKVVANYLALAGTVAAGVALATLVGGTRTTFGGTFVVDDFALAFKGLFLGTLALVALMSKRYLQGRSPYQGEFYFLLLSSVVGMLLMASVRDLLMLFIALEIVSATGFILAGFRKGDARSSEGAIKFLLIGVLSTALMLFGMSLVYGLTGSLRLADVATRLAGVAGDGDLRPLAIMSVFLVLTGFAFKVSAAPFHFWAPDTYEGAPVPVAAFLSVASKAAGFAGLLQLTLVGFPALVDAWAPAIAVLAAVTMLVGNVIALAQTQMVRLLAYSSVAHAGYMLVPFAVAGVGDGTLRDQAIQALLIYLVIYGISNLGAFAVVTLVGQRQPGNLIADYDGLGRRSPGLAAALSVFLLSLAGLPPIAGWYAKLVIFLNAISAGEAWLTALAVWMAVMTVVAFFYYLAVIRRVWLSAPAEAEAGDGVPAPAPALTLPAGVAIGAAAAGVFLLGVLPNLIAQYAPLPTLVASG